MSSRIEARSIGYFVAALIASCAPFVANSGDADGGGGASVDGGATGDGPALDASGASDSDSSAADAASFEQDGGFCGTFTDAIECFDFDEVNPPSGLILSQNSGAANTFGPTFDGGSPPKALVVTSTTVSGRATATAAAIDFLAHKNATITIAFLFHVSAASTAIEYIGRLTFTGQSSMIGLTAMNMFECAGAQFPIAIGTHSVSLSMAVDPSGSVAQYTCSFDLSGNAMEQVVPSKILKLELGNAASGSGSFTVSYDNVVVRAQ